MTAEFPEPECIGCGRQPHQIDEYIQAGRYENMTPKEYVLAEEGTLNPMNNHFACTSCYMSMGTPSGADGIGGPGRWMAP